MIGKGLTPREVDDFVDAVVRGEYAAPDFQTPNPFMGTLDTPDLGFYDKAEVDVFLEALHKAW